MFKIMCIDHIVLSVKNMDAMVLFYCDVLGCTIENTQKEIGLIQLRAGESIIDLQKTENTSNDNHKNLEHFCLRIDPFDCDALKKYFQKKNIEIYRYGNRYGAQGIGQSPIKLRINLRQRANDMTDFVKSNQRVGNGMCLFLCHVHEK